MHWLAFVGLHEPPNFWVRIGAFNLSLAIVCGAFFGISLRSFVLFVLERERSSKERVLRFLKGTVFMVLGGLYAHATWPMLAWDRPARALAVLTLVMPPVVAAIRHARGHEARLPRAIRRAVAWILIFVLLIAAVDTLLRSGMITLKTDRVTMMLQLTGEIRDQNLSSTGASGPVEDRLIKAHRVILWLSDGTQGADVWVRGDRVAFQGRAILFSKGLNKMGVPNLYQFETIQSSVSESEGSPESGTSSTPFPYVGSLAVRSWWRPIQAWIFDHWPRGEPDNSLLGIQIVRNRSPDYPLVGAGGAPIERRFLLDLTLEGVPTSRGSSPLEGR
jgi:hypothetical protein